MEGLILPTEELIVKLDADTKKMDAKLESSTDKLNDLDESTNKADLSLSSLSKTAIGGAKIVAGVGAAAATAAAAISTMVVMAGKGQMELEQLARQAKLSTSEFKALSFATRQYGIEGENIADISKDIADKMGEFARDASGPFQDVANALGLTTEEAQALAIQMEDLSSEQVIGELVSRMEDAGLSTNNMIQVTESLGNDLSKLIPLFQNNGAELSKLKGQYNSATGAIQLTREEADKLKESATAFDLLTDSLGDASNKILANIAEPVTNFFKELTSIIPFVTEDLLNFIGIFDDSVSKKNSVTESFSRNIESGAPVSSSDSIESSAVKQIKTESEIIAEIKSNNDDLERERIEENDKAALEAINRRFMTEKELITEKYNQELELAEGHDETILNLKIEHTEALSKIDEEFTNDQQRRRREDSADAQREMDANIRAQRKAAREREQIERGYLNAASSINTSLLDDNKEVGKGIIVADAAVGTIKAFRDLPYPAAIAAGVSINLSALQALQEVDSSGRGGGSVSAPVSSALPQESAQQSQSSDISILSSDAGSAGNNELRVTVNDDNASDFAIALANLIQVEQRSGNI